MAAQSFRIVVRIDDKAVRAALKQARRQAGPHIRKGLKDVAERVAVPKVRHLAPGSIDRTIKGGATTRTAYVQSRDPRVGLLNFGGTRRDHIKPRRAQAVLTPYGPRAVVRTPRRYKSQHFMERGVADSIGQAVPLLEDAVIDAFRQAGLEVT